MKTVVRESVFDAQLFKLEADVHRADELISGAEWQLSRNPKIGFNIEGTPVWVITVRDNPKQRQLIVFYTFTGEKVYLMAVTEDKL